MTDKHSDYGSQSTTTFGYVVEARAVVLDVSIRDEDGKLVTFTPERWTRVPTKTVLEEGPPSFLNPFKEHNGLMTFAEAHRVIAEASIRTWPRTPALEFRLVKVELKWSYETREVGVGETIRPFEREQFEKWIPRSEGSKA